MFPCIAEMTWDEASEAFAQSPTGIIPVGAVEVYGPHLPCGSDGIFAWAVAQAVAKSCPCILAPLIPVGCSDSMRDFPGYLTVSPDSLRGYLAGVASSLTEQGCRSLLFINGHAGNVPVISQVCESFRRQGTACMQIDLWRFIQSTSEGVFEDPQYPYGHAGEAGTSILLYLVPDLVKMHKAAPTEPSETERVGLLEYRGFRNVTETGVVGNPKLASKAKGAEVFARTVSAIIELVKTRLLGEAEAATRSAT